MYNQIGIVHLGPAFRPSQGLANFDAAPIWTFKLSAATLGMRKRRLHLHDTDCMGVPEKCSSCTSSLPNLDPAILIYQALVMEACNLLGMYCPHIGQERRQHLRCSMMPGYLFRHKYRPVVTVASGWWCCLFEHQHSVQGSRPTRIKQ